MPLFRGFHDAALVDYPAAAPKLAVYEALRRVLNALVTDLMNEVRGRVTASALRRSHEIRQRAGKARRPEPAHGSRARRGQEVPLR